MLMEMVRGRFCDCKVWGVATGAGAGMGGGAVAREDRARRGCRASYLTPREAAIFNTALRGRLTARVIQGDVGLGRRKSMAVVDSGWEKSWG